MIKGAVLVLSGKGGVGKTLVAVNIALQLKEKGFKTGLLDADFSASNTGFFLPVKDEQMRMEREILYPANIDGLEYFSMPLFLGEKSVSMTGDQYSQLLKDAVTAAEWQAEYLIVDCPAGYSDELKTAARIFSDVLLGSIIVTQPAHKLDTERALRLHKDLEMPILGLIENMSFLKVGKVEWKIFGESVVETLGEEFEVPVFGKIPLSMKIRKQIEQKDPLLKDVYAEPIIKAVNAILNAKPQKPGFIARMKKFLSTQLTKFVVELTVAINQEISIPQIQQTFGYPGGTIIRLNIYDEDMETIITQTDWIINEGKLTAVEGEYHIDSQIDITPKAFKWAFLGDKILTNGCPYTFQDALRLGQMRIYGERVMVRGAFFMQQVFQDLTQNSKAMDRIRPILKVL